MDTKENANRLKGFFEDLQLQLALGRADAIDEFEKQKANLKKIVDENMAKLAESTDKLTGSDIGTKMNTKFDELRVQLALGKAETKEALEKQSEAINNSVKKIKDDLGEKYPDLVKSFDDSVTKLTSMMESLRLQFALGKAELNDETERERSILFAKIDELKKKVEEGKNIAEEKFDGVKDELSEALNHLKNAIAKLK